MFVEKNKSNYLDVENVYIDIENLMKLKPIQLNRSAMKSYLDYFNNKCTKSKNMITEAKKYIPGGVQHNLAFNYPFPLVIRKADGAYLWDIDNNRYIDFLQAGGPTVLGSNYSPVREKVIELINECGPSTGLFHEYEMKIAKLICDHFPSVDMFRMLGSGTEAVMGAIRIARLATGKKKIIKIGGAYHGWSDQMVYDLKIPGTKRFEAHGIPKASSKHTQSVYPNDISALRKKLIFNRIKGGTAAIIVEGMGPESGTRPIHFEFNQKVRELCDEFGVIFIIDEVVTAFRIGLGGAQEYFGVKADLTVFGKVIAGGYPAAGGIGGKQELMEYLAAGLETGKKRAYVGGTMAANPLSSLAGYYTIKYIESTKACEKASIAGDKISKGLSELIEDNNLLFVSYNTGSIVHLETVAPMFMKIKIGLSIMNILKEIKVRKFVMEEYGAAFMAEGIVTLAGSRLYTSMATTDDVVEDALIRFDRVFKQVDFRNEL